jgi:hypothetical protein
VWFAFSKRACVNCFPSFLLLVERMGSFCSREVGKCDPLLSLVCDDDWQNARRGVGKSG